VVFRRTVTVAVPVRSGEHACCHFADADDRTRLTVAFVRERLRRGDKVVAFLDADEGAALVAQLEDADAGFEAAMARGQFGIRPAHDAYIPDGRFEADRMLRLLGDEHRAALAEGYSGLSLIGEMPGALCDVPGGEDLVAYEARIAGNVDPPSPSVLCQYDHGRFGARVLADVSGTHDVIASPELAAIGRDGDVAAAHDRERDTLRLAGELDFGSALTVSEVLDAHFPGPLRLDLGDLSFVDVAGMRALRGGAGRSLTVGPVSDAVREMLTLLAWDTDPDIEILETGSSAHAPQPLGL
jgi:ABC-type transporter Mla MlaB component